MENSTTILVGRNSRSNIALIIESSGLSVGAPDRNRIGFETHQIGKQLAAVNHWCPALFRGNHLDIVLGHRFRYYDDLGLAHVRRLMPLVKPKPALDQPVRDCRRLQVRSRGFIAQIQQNLGQTAHADPADADKMDFSFGSVQRDLAHPTYCGFFKYSITRTTRERVVFERAPNAVAAT